MLLVAILASPAIADADLTAKATTCLDPGSAVAANTDGASTATSETAELAAGPTKSQPRSKTWMELAAAVGAKTDEMPAAAGEAPRPAAKPAKGPPLPFHCIDGYAGGLITPMAYFVNPGPKGTVVAPPSLSYSYTNIGSKDLHTFTLTQVFFRRLEFGYSYNYLAVGSLYDDLRKAGLDMGRDHVQLHSFNLRLNVLPENSFDLPLPALTTGIHFKYNDGIERIDQSLGGAFTGIGYESRCGIEYTLTATKMFTEPCLKRPVIVSAGLRLSNAAQLGLFGFGNEYNATFECNVAYLPIDQIVLAYEFRMKNNSYNRIAELVDKEDNWHAFSVSWIATDRLTLTGVLGMLGTIGNTQADPTFSIQVKYEF